MNHESSHLPTVVILHGWSQRTTTEQKWQPLISQLEDQGLQVKYLNLPGLSAPLEEVWNLQDYRDWVLQQIEDIDSLTLIGHSFGGQIAAVVAASQPDNLDRLVLIGPAGIRDRRWHKVIKRLIFKVAAKLGNYVFAWSSLKQWLQKLLYKLAREQDYYQASALLKQTMKQVLKQEIHEQLLQITVPTLLIWGEKDRATPFAHSQIFLNNINNSQLKSLPQSGHCPHYYHPQAIAKDITNFLRENNNA